MLRLRLCQRPWPSLRQAHQPFLSSHRARYAETLARSDALPSFTETLARATPPPPFTSSVPRPRIGRQLVFAVVVGAWGMSIAANATTSATRSTIKTLTDASPDHPAWQTRPPTNDEMYRTRYLLLGKKLQASLSALKDRVEKWPGTIKGMVVWSYANVAQSWLDANDGRRMCWRICMFNTAVWAAWQIPRFHPFMSRHFMHHPLSGLSYTLLTSMFSHRSLLHLVFNNMAMSSFGSAAAVYLSKQQTSRGCEREATSSYHLLAFLVAGGLFSGLVSHVASARILWPAMLKRLAPTSASPAVASAVKAGVEESGRQTRILPSLGISGAVYSAVALTTCAFPDTEISLIFPPSYPIPIQYGVGALVTMDVIGILRGWRYLDHYAHLGGAAFGALYYYYGPASWNHLMCVAAEAVPQGEDEESYRKEHKPFANPS